MAAANLSTEVQLRYLLTWFSEWSELQRSDFLPIIAERVGGADCSLNMNGILTSMADVNCQDKPMNLFQCRVKLFRSWTATWSADDVNKLTQKLAEVDPAFGVKLAEELNPATVKDDFNAQNETNGESMSDESGQIAHVNILEEISGLDTNQREMIEA